jgi:methyl-accepting chemotaxis protein
LQSIHETSVAMDEMAKGIELIATSSEEVSVSSSNSQHTAENGMRILKETFAIIENLVENSNDSVIKMQLLDVKTIEIGQIIDVITNIAGQTNLLALNASIEAARAGDQGRGFAVVANEVKKLAEQSSHSALNISDMIRAVQTETAEVVEQINQSSTQTQLGLEAVKNAGFAFEQISKEVDMVTKQVINVSATVEEMSASTEEVAATVQSLVHTVEQSTAKAEIVSVSSQETSASMQELLATSERLSELSEELDLLISRFKL